MNGDLTLERMGRPSSQAWRRVAANKLGRGSDSDDYLAPRDNKSVLRYESLCCVSNEELFQKTHSADDLKKSAYGKNIRVVRKCMISNILANFYNFIVEKII